MKLYHGSKNKFSLIKKNQASKADYIEVPESELLDAIYLTPDYGFSLANAVCPKGVNNIAEEDKTIIFENPELFNPEEDAFVYEVDISNIPKENIIEVDHLQYAIIGIDGLDILNRFDHKAKDVENYYELKNWKKENNKEKEDRHREMRRGLR